MINKILSIREKYHSGFIRTTSDINQIVIHGTGGGVSAKGLINWMLSGERSEEYKKGIALFHYLIDRNGEIYEIIDPKNWVYHSSSGKHDKYTIGIELLNPEINNSGEYTDLQYCSLLKLIFDELLFFYRDINSIIGHGACKKKYSGMYKVCPGEKFNWDKILDELITNEYEFNTASEYIYNIQKIS